MTDATRLMTRRTFLRDLGHGAFALTAITLIGCSGKALASFDPSSPDPKLLTYDGNLDELEAFWCNTGPPVTSGDPSDSITSSPPHWARIGDQGSSGYVLVRGGEATVVDTGSWCVPHVIEDALNAVGLGWSAVGSVIVTHKHPDHWIGLPTAVEHAPDAGVYAGAADIEHIASPRAIVPVGAGDRIMDLAIIPTPGHTPGHIAVHDKAAGVLVAGDAIAGFAGHLDLLPTSEDLAQTRVSLGILANLSFATLLPGHGLPSVGGAWEVLAAYIARS
jgi:glyoxylase-like metal-dependent hydrolase (beta-lactamase superfamily II)